MASSSERLPPDFRVRYRLYSAEEGGRKTPHFQHIRWDFAYEDVEISPPNQVFMIWPEFITPSGEMLPEGEPMPQYGLADMYILNSAFREFHSQHIRVGTKGYFREGGLIIGQCEVVELIALHQNPKS
ncbi:hypothetical protein [Hymenobacter ruricola]|uniref:YopX protein domain-containing protein n=1 Tax=Hymenobacter ruricola TaxID=2791023 RepID=A0ABS0I073_9BACT|nr:hypothetical protein [Hymenobacter ruricola]MBF9220123.1 hypothetical protein [Hymenobacter ruricola]